MLYNPKAFFTHAVLLDQACAHCPIFPTAASRRSLGPCLSPNVADHPLRPAIDRCLGELLPHQQANLTRAHLIVRPFKKRASFPRRAYAVLFRISSGYPPLLGRFPRVTHPSATRQQRSKLLSVTVRLACVKHTASVQSEPGSNSSVNFTKVPKYPLLL